MLLLLAPLLPLALAVLDTQPALRPITRADLPLPKRMLEWGDVNFISTSDTHGWLLGHQHDTWPEPNYSGDFGTFASFVTHMREEALLRGVDLLLTDQGDHHDGGGIVSASREGAEAVDEIFNYLEYDVLTLGNHELYQYPSALWLYENRHRWRGRYLTSNVNITVEEDGEVVSRPIADRVRKFKSTMGRAVTAFGVLFDFKAHDHNITVQAPTKMAKEAWFQEAIAEEPDYFVLVGHMPGRGLTSEWKPVFDAIRKVHPSVPVYVFGGHTHVRDCVQYDDRSVAVVPGRYLETVAFTSSSLPASKDDDGPLVINRRYLDANPWTYQFHTGTTDYDFDTPLGLNISMALDNLATVLKLKKPFGTVPHDLFLARHPYGHPRSILTVFAEKVIPEVLHDDKRHGPRIVIGNAGSLRFDVFAGTFDRNDELTVSPFTTAFLYMRLPAGLAEKITIEMNRAGASKLMNSPPSPDVDDDAYVRHVYQSWLAEQWDTFAAEHLQGSGISDVEDVLMLARSDATKPHTLGYVTHDACPGKGDDIEHIPVPIFLDQPSFLQSPLPKGVRAEDEIDVVVMDYAMQDFLIAANVLAPEREISEDDFKPYAEGTLINEVLGKYARIAW